MHVQEVIEGLRRLRDVARTNAPPFETESVARAYSQILATIVEAEEMLAQDATRGIGPAADVHIVDQLKLELVKAKERLHELLINRRRTLATVAAAQE